MFSNLRNTFVRVVAIFVLLPGSQHLLLAQSSPLRVLRTDGIVEIDNGLVKARFSTGKYGVKQEYLAARGTEWVLLAECFRPKGAEKAKLEAAARQPRGSVAPLYDTSLDPAHRFLASEALQSIGQVEEKADSAQVVLRGGHHVPMVGGELHLGEEVLP